MRRAFDSKIYSINSIPDTTKFAMKSVVVHSALLVREVDAARFISDVNFRDTLIRFLARTRGRCVPSSIIFKAPSVPTTYRGSRTRDSLDGKGERRAARAGNEIEVKRRTCDCDTGVVGENY